MKKEKLIWLSAILVSLNACDTRDDYFLEHGETPIIEMKTANDTMSSEFWEGKKYRIIEVGFGRPDTLTFSINDPYGKESTYDFRLTSIPAENEANGVYAEELLYFFGEDVCIPGIMVKEIPSTYGNLDIADMGQYSKTTEVIDLDGSIYMRYYDIADPFLKMKKSNGKIIFSLDEERTKNIAGDYRKQIVEYRKGYDLGSLADAFWREIPFSKEVSARYSLTAKNKIGVETTEYLHVKIKPNRQPVPSLEVTCVDKENGEYKILAGGTDLDGHKIVKWSYLFDYLPFKIGSDDIMHHEYEGSAPAYIVDGNLYYNSIATNISILKSLDEEKCFYYSTFGMGKETMKWEKIEADFITPTTRNEIYHTFQSKGEHTISVRCQDEYGLWSDYITQKIILD